MTQEYKKVIEAIGVAMAELSKNYDHEDGLCYANLLGLSVYYKNKAEKKKILNLLHSIPEHVVNTKIVPTDDRFLELAEVYIKILARFRDRHGEIRGYEDELREELACPCYSGASIDDDYHDDSEGLDSFDSMYA